jgi:hypothetical protein
MRALRLTKFSLKSLKMFFILGTLRNRSLLLYCTHKKNVKENKRKAHAFFDAYFLNTSKARGAFWNTDEPWASSHIPVRCSRHKKKSLPAASQVWKALIILVPRFLASWEKGSDFLCWAGCGKDSSGKMKFSLRY